jgi:ER membrane protein SH3
MDFIIGRSSHVGVLLACFTVDYRVLFEPLTEETIQDGFQYYKTFYNAPLGIKVQNLSLCLLSMS